MCNVQVTVYQNSDATLVNIVSLQGMYKNIIGKCLNIIAKKALWSMFYIQFRANDNLRS